MIAKAIQAIIDVFGLLVVAILSALPDSPFTRVTAVLGEWAGWVNYFIPVGAIMNLLAAYTGAVAVWYGIRWVLRFAKYID